MHFATLDLRTSASEAWKPSELIVHGEPIVFLPEKCATGLSVETNSESNFGKVIEGRKADSVVVKALFLHSSPSSKYF